MEITADTKIEALLQEYPFLLDFLVGKSERFKDLENPVMRQTLGQVATLRHVAAVVGLEVDTLVAEIAAEVARRAGGGTAASRQEVLKGIIRDLHRGQDVEAARARFRELVRDITPGEIAELEQRLIAEGLPESEVRQLCDVHVQVFKEALERQAVPQAGPGHPVDTFMKENRAAEQLLGDIRRLLAEVGDPPDATRFAARRDELAGLLEDLSSIHLHYLRKENHLFPLLEARGVSGPTQVMWGIHDDIRAGLKQARARVAADEVAAVSDLKDALQKIDDMIYKEEHILFPMALETLTEADWAKVREGEEEIGYAWIRPAGAAESPAAGAAAEVPAGSIRLGTGALSVEQLGLVLDRLPVDITVVDENDRVVYYSRGAERIFPRSPAIIGRTVQNCHPPQSVGVVNRILEAFRSGEKSEAEFWINRGGRFILIRYYALRAADGTYRGCLEVSQDVTSIRALEGERRLLDWD